MGMSSFDNIKITEPNPYSTPRYETNLEINAKISELEKRINDIENLLKKMMDDLKGNFDNILDIIEFIK